MKTKYVPDLTRQMAVCEANYARLIKLMPDIEYCQQRDFIVDMAQQQSVVSICVLERFKFTSTLSINQTLASASMDTQIQQLISPKLQVRLYHDANMAEVINLANYRQLKGKYLYPNKEMHQVDEKIQLNEHLAQWLSHCLTHGYHTQEIFIQNYINHDT
ncbi:MAG: DUF1249 domain-containing protein [Oceanospirillaceae bacterium]